MMTDELAHIIKNLASQSFQEHRPWVYGHISVYNPVDHTARVIVPSMRDDHTGAPLLSPWMPMPSAQVGANTGIQVVPLGGATSEKPTDGELCMVALNERSQGVSAIVAMFYTGVQQPPHVEIVKADRTQGLLPGELLIHHSSGAFQRFHSDGSVSVQAGPGKPVIVTTTGAGVITLVSAQEIDMTAPIVKITGQLQVTQEVTAGFGTGDSVTLQQHRHGTTGSSATSTVVPTAGT
jgi:phage gp45-like